MLPDRVSSPEPLTYESGALPIVLRSPAKSCLSNNSKSCLSNNSKTAEANLTKLHRKIEHNEKVCRAQELGSYAQGQGHNQVKGQIVPKIVLLINY